ncbi:MAG: branched-chain-amino-acid transaminase [Phycisphaerales bacterium]|nr:branched-chain-amino-acid transaminase [Phycisphaerales bacterium]
MTSISSNTGIDMAEKPQTTSPATDSSEPMIWVNGKMVPKSQATVSVFDHGLLYGDGIFEGIRIYNGKIFKLEQHMDRLYDCADKIFLDIGVSREEMIRIQRQCVEANNITNGYIRLVITRGEGSLGLNPYQCPKAGVICIADTISLFKPVMYETGMRVVLANRPKTPIDCLDPRVKTLNYLNNIMAKCEAIHLSRELGITKPEDQLLECIMLSTDGKVAEGSGDNIFIIKDGKLFTPPSEVGILEGITRRFVKDELCPMLGLSVEEKYFTIEDVYDADEVFLTGSAAEMIAVREVLEHDNLKLKATHTISAGEGPITNKLRLKFREIVTSDNVPED